MSDALWVLAGILALAAGYTDWRWRRIPNWLTVPGLVVGIGANAFTQGWTGVKSSLLGVGLGLALLLPLVLVRSLGAGDWKLAGALGAFVGPQRLIAVLLGTILVAGLMAIVLIIAKRRVGQTARNIWQMLVALVRFHMPSREVSLDNPESLKIPFGVAMAATVVAMAVGHMARVG
ncbi:MAG TPA: A24 family peptidase [Terriglobales bacterium]|jgi:prepilin peptidase CpaA|nr:A24 family peptidase [Terriglobales bacterium]